MIPRAIEMIFDVSKQLHDRGWKYEMEGSFLEVYNDVVSFVVDSLNSHARSTTSSVHHSGTPRNMRSRSMTTT
jgi:hypothetical protein